VTTAFPCDYSDTFRTIPTTLGKRQVKAQHIVDAAKAWVESNLKTEYGFEINGNEIYWINYAELSPICSKVGEHLVRTNGPLLRVGVTRGGSEGWILRCYVDGRSEPIIWAKLWTLDAACQLQAALTRASADCLA